jgi:hypothetical protein
MAMNNRGIHKLDSGGGAISRYQFAAYGTHCNAPAGVKGCPIENLRITDALKGL